MPKNKKNRVEQLVAQRSTEELQFAAEWSSKRERFQEPNKAKCLSAEDALALNLDLNLSCRKYEVLRAVVNSLHPKCFPAKQALKNAKLNILPQNIEVTEVSAEVNLQEFINLTAERIFLNISLSEDTSVVMDCKWGFDGSSGHSTYKDFLLKIPQTSMFFL